MYSGTPEFPSSGIQAFVNSGTPEYGGKKFVAGVAARGPKAMECNAMPRKKPLGQVIGVGNQKGGVGKSTNTIHLAAALGQRGYKALVIDLDAHAGSTRSLGVHPKSYAGTLELLTSEDESVANLVVTEKLPRNVHLIPSRIQLAEVDRYVSKYVDQTKLLARPLAEACEAYDFIFLDTAPAAGFMPTVAAYSIAEWFILSAFPQHLSMEGLVEALDEISDVRQHANQKLEVLGVLLTCVDGRVRRSRQRIEEMLDEALPGRLFSTVTSQANVVATMAEKGKTLFQAKHLHDHKVTHQYRRIAAELEYRVLNREAFLDGTLAPPDFERLLGETLAEMTPNNDGVAATVAVEVKPGVQTVVETSAPALAVNE